MGTAPDQGLPLFYGARLTAWGQRWPRGVCVQGWIWVFLCSPRAARMLSVPTRCAPPCASSGPTVPLQQDFASHPAPKPRLLSGAVATFPCALCHVLEGGSGARPRAPSPKRRGPSPPLRSFPSCCRSLAVLGCAGEGKWGRVFTHRLQFPKAELIIIIALSGPLISDALSLLLSSEFCPSPVVSAGGLILILLPPQKTGDALIHCRQVMGSQSEG